SDVCSSDLRSGGSPFPEIRRELESAAGQMGITLSFVEIKSPDDIDSGLSRIKRGGAGGVIAPLGPFTYTNRVKVVQLALKHRLPGLTGDATSSRSEVSSRTGRA